MPFKVRAFSFATAVTVFQRPLVTRPYLDPSVPIGTRSSRPCSAAGQACRPPKSMMLDAIRSSGPLGRLSFHPRRICAMRDRVAARQQLASVSRLTISRDPRVTELRSVPYPSETVGSTKCRLAILRDFAMSEAGVPKSCKFLLTQAVSCSLTEEG